MTTPVFPTTVIGPTYPVKVTYTPRIIKSSFGDGYTQQGPDGINSLLLQFDLTWAVLTSAERTTINNFLVARGGYQSFTWTDPDGTTRLIRCASWAFSSDNPGTWSLQTTFNEVPL